MNKKPVLNTGFFVQNYPRIKRYASPITAPHTKIPTDTKRRLLLAIVVTSEDIHVLSCVKTVASPSRLATTSAVSEPNITLLSTFKPCSYVNRRKQKANKGNSKRQDDSTGKNDNNIIFSCANQGDRHAENIA